MYNVGEEPHQHWSLSGDGQNGIQGGKIVVDQWKSLSMLEVGVAHGVGNSSQMLSSPVPANMLLCHLEYAPFISLD